MKEGLGDESIVEILEMWKMNESRILWMIFLLLLISNLILSFFDYFSSVISYPFILPIVMFVSTVVLAVVILLNSKSRIKIVFPILLLLALSHYSIVLSLFALTIWMMNGFAP